MSIPSTPRGSAKRLRFHPRHQRGGASTALHGERLYEILGHERPCGEGARLLRSYVHGCAAPVVGAMRLSCSDEAEQENIEAFQRQFVRYLLPSLKFSSKSPFRSANLGGRYEWGAVRIAEDHFALAKGADDWKILVVKVNSHVSIGMGADGPHFGRGGRYDGESSYCGALDAVLAGSHAPFAETIARDLDFGGHARLEELRDPARVDPKHRSLFAAVLQARIQARRAMIDVQDHTPKTPTLYFILPCVTLNQAGHDSEIVCGIYSADRRGSEPHDEYCGIGDRPGEYRIDHDGQRLRLSDPGLNAPRIARDHRRDVQTAWEKRRESAGAAEVDERTHVALAAARQKVPGGPVASVVLKTLLGALFVTSPIPAAMLLFGEGLVDIHHASKAHTLAREAQDDEAARSMLSELDGPLSRLDDKEAQHLLQLLAAQYGVAGA